MSILFINGSWYFNALGQSNKYRLHMIETSITNLRS